MRQPKPMINKGVRQVPPAAPKADAGEEGCRRMVLDMVVSMRNALAKFP